MRRPAQTTGLIGRLLGLCGLCWLLVFGAGLIQVTPAYAQSGSVTVDDPDNLLSDRAEVEAAAQRLADEGADVVVLLVDDAGVTPQEAQSYLDQRLDQLDLAPNSKSLRGDQIVFYVAPNPGFNGIYYVSRYQPLLGSVYERIVAEQMQPLFTQGNFSGGMAAGIDAVRTTINPPASPIPWVIGGVVAVGIAGAAAVPALRRRQAMGEALADARKRMEQARAAAGVALADLGRRFDDAREKAKFDKVSYSPNDVTRLAQLQQEAETQFAQAQALFDAAEEDQIAEGTPNAQHYDAITSKFTQVQHQAATITQSIAQVEMLRSDLDRNGSDPRSTQRLNQ